MITKSMSLATLFTLSTLSVSAFANNDYQHDARVNFNDYSEGEQDGDLSLGYKYYFSPVSQKNKPYLLSGFLSQTSNVGGQYNGINGDYDSVGISGEYVLDSKWFLMGSVNSFESDNGYDSNMYTVGGGYYFNDSSSVFLNYATSSSEVKYALGNQVVTSDSDSDGINLGVNSYLELDWTEGVFIQATYHYQDYQTNVGNNKYDDSSSGLSAQADWYITNSWSVGVAYSADLDDSDSGNDIWEVGTDYYWSITDNIAAVFHLSKVEDSDGFGYSVGVNGRF